MNDTLAVSRVRETGAKSQLWDDRAFKLRLTRAARGRGMTLAELFAEAGVSRFYVARPRDGRNTNTVLNLARILNMSPADLLGVPEATARAEMDGDRDRLDRLTVVTRMMAAQLAAMVYVVSNDKSEADPAILMEMVLREINGDDQDGDSGAKA